MYSYSTSCVKINDKLTEFFATKLGVKQGDNLILTYLKIKAFWMSTRQANTLPSLLLQYLSIMVFRINMWSDVLAFFVNPSTSTWQSLIPCLHKLFNNCFTMSYYPENWTHGYITDDVVSIFSVSFNSSISFQYCLGSLS
jgi:hypothetical protein